MLEPADLEKLRKAGKIAAKALEIGMNAVGDGILLRDVAEEIESFIRSNGALPAFPVNLSINEVAAHYTPSPNDKIKFETGDVVKVDVGAHIDGFVGDTAGTVEVGTRNFTALIEASKRARDSVMEMIGEGCPINEVGKLVNASIRRDGYLPIQNLSGHQIVRGKLHAGLSIPNVDDGNTEQVERGMILAIEPFATNGAGSIRPGKAGNIFRIAREREIADQDVKEFFDLLRSKVSTFPFCERWIDHPKASAYISKLVRHGILTSYTQLLEVKKGCVTQSEHTVYISGKRAEITTLP